ncbi:MAG TPA: nitronate monooxygenase [Hyphomonas sp.]|nr:2-nitropropane dioxygenase [Hyphomonas sp.]MAN65691.1 2-nitropropane dioxygenase [Hyphomonadaceae bacterium]HBL92380.1 nitronate monooxygenase [Hyphomonas sp.]HCJ17963.1 nitronate monooxygenase [Hyphomonas sp.]HCN93717.1 nitronate monooxygenase [Hyphomonas sp.]
MCERGEALSIRINRFRLRLPLMAAPMSIASNVPLVAACSRAGIMGCFPTHNANRDGGLASWITRIDTARQIFADEGGLPAPFAVNLNVSRKKPAETLANELAICREARLPVITTNAGNPAEVVKQVHDWGGIVIHDATTMEQAEKAVAAGVDGLMLVCAGAGGLGGLLTPFAFVPKVRRFFDGIIQLAGGVASGEGIAAAELLGADMVCMGTRFIATEDSGTVPGHKQMLTDVSLSDVLWTDAICGINANFLRPSIVANQLDPDHLPPPSPTGRPTLPAHIKPWSMVWSGGHSAALIDSVPSVAGLVDELERDYLAARKSWTR